MEINFNQKFYVYCRTEEEVVKLFLIMKTYGYKWKDNTNLLSKSNLADTYYYFYPDKIVTKSQEFSQIYNRNTIVYTIQDIINNC